MALAGKVGTHLLGRGHQRHGALDQAAALLIELQRAAFAVKQRSAQLGLQALQGFRHRTGRQVERIGR